MALTLYTTFMTDWNHGESSTLSVHVTEQGARQRLLDYMISELIFKGEWNDDLTLKARDLLDKYACSWDDNRLRINGLEKTHIQSFFNELADYFNYIENTCWFEYSTHTLEG
jgi:hypothetical protein